MAWILTKLPEYTSWALLIALALYDLCAVLSPCGPLKALINLAQERQDPIPGLLYEANVGPERRGGNNVHDTFSSGRARAKDRTLPGRHVSDGEVASAKAPSDITAVRDLSRPEIDADCDGIHSVVTAVEASSGMPSNARQELPGNANRLQPLFTRPEVSRELPVHDAHDSDAHSESYPPRSRHASSSGGLPALETGHTTPVEPSHPPPAPLSPAAALLRGVPSGYAPVPVSQTAPSGSAPKASAPLRADEPTVFVSEDDPEDRSIKLGLGDFVFYSVLVSRAALFDFSTFMACLVSVLMGLGGTLLLLGLFKVALPAVSTLMLWTLVGCCDSVCFIGLMFTRSTVTPSLQLPISIFLGVTVYFLCAALVTPMFVELTLSGAAV